MRNLKKILALVLALVMTFSVMATANAFTDDKDIDATYEEAVAVLNGLKVFKGYEDGSFQPKGNITRAEVAAIIYRVVTGDVNNAQVGIYADYNKFTDVKSTAWYAGYVNFCANAEYIKGYGDGTFGPNDQVTGYQALAMILRAIGYDKNGEFTGASWQVQTAAVGKKLGVTDNVTAGTLGTAATREVVAEILFRTIAYAPQVDYTLAFGYTTIGNETLGVETFGLTKGAATTDNWGRPCYNWTAAKPASVKGTVATINEKADATYYVATTECQIASDISLKANTEYTLYTNGKNNASKYVIQPLDTVQTLGAQGTLLEVYKSSKVVVAIDTFLAIVNDVKDATYDAAGHLKTPSVITLGVFTTDTASTAAGQTVVLTNKSTNYTYTKGEMVLVNAWTKNATPAANGNVTVNSIATTSTTIVNVPGYTGQLVADYAVILGTAEAKTGTQSYVLYNAPYHIVDGTTYNDAKWFKLDQAQYDDDNAHTWYFDSYGNLIGATDIATQYTYGIVENIQWQNPAMAYGYAQATIRYMDGTTETKVVTAIDGKTLTYKTTNTYPSFADGIISTSLLENADECGKHLYRINTASAGTISLEQVFTDSDNNDHNYTVSGTTVAVTTGELNHIADAQINKFGTGVAAVSAITNGTATIYANANTKFLVQTVSNGVATYNVVEGYLNMAKYSNATVDYVNLDDDSYVDYVYVTGTPDSAAAYYGLFYLNTNVGIQAYYNAANNNYGYYVVDGILDGVAGTYKVAANAPYSTTLIDGSAVALSDFASMVGKLAYVRVEGDKITGIWNAVADETNLFTITHNNAAYQNLMVSIQAASATAGTTTKTGDVLKVGTEYYNVGGLTPVVGAWADDMSNKNVYVIYDNSKTIAGASVAKAVYIVDVADSSIGSGVAPAAAAVNRVLKIVNKQTGEVIATYSSQTVAADGVTAGASYTYTLNGMASVVGVSATNLTSFGASSVTVTAVAGATVDAVLYAYYN